VTPLTPTIPNCRFEPVRDGPWGSETPWSFSTWWQSVPARYASTAVWLEVVCVAYLFVRLRAEPT